jgi:hypothetical protein
MFYILIILLLLSMIFFVGNLAVFISAWMGLTLVETKMMVTGYGAATFVALLVWALLDKGRKNGSE